MTAIPMAEASCSSDDDDEQDTEPDVHQLMASMYSALDVLSVTLIGKSASGEVVPAAEGGEIAKLRKLAMSRSHPAYVRTALVILAIVTVEIGTIAYQLIRLTGPG